MNRDLGDERRDYHLKRLERSELPDDPMTLFSDWLDQALRSTNPDPTAMNISTVDQNGQPSSRIVLLKKVEKNRLVFFTNYHSRKSSELIANNKIAAHFFWPELERQIRITGTAMRIRDEDSDLYFRSRPYESKIAAWASPQSKEIPNRQYLDKEFEKYSKIYRDTENIPRPENWGGMAILPLRIEFWQGGGRRLHDRIEYTLKEGKWLSIRLAP